MEILVKQTVSDRQLKAVLLDFGGTLSTLRHGWEEVMTTVMIEMIHGSTPKDEILKREVEGYIQCTTGVQTIHQMKWLAETVKRFGRNPGAPKDPRWYKWEYHRRLMRQVDNRKSAVRSGEELPERYMVPGAKDFLSVLSRKGIDVYVASGTDHPDVVEEAEILGVRGLVNEIAGADPAGEACSKEAVLHRLMTDYGLKGSELAIVGDGPVEIRLGRDTGALTLGVASDEEKPGSIHRGKRQRLIRAGVHAIVPDFFECAEIMEWLGGGCGV